MSEIIRDTNTVYRHSGENIKPLKMCNGVLLASNSAFMCLFEPIQDDMSVFISIDDKDVGEYQNAFISVLKTGYVTSVKCNDNTRMTIKQLSN